MSIAESSKEPGYGEELPSAQHPNSYPLASGNLSHSNSFHRQSNSGAT